MEEAIDFMIKFIDEEYETFIAQYTERDDKKFKDRLANMSKFYEGEMKPEARRSPGKDDQWFEKAKEGLQSVKPRILFQIKHYDNKKIGDLYRTYTSNYLRAGNKANYFANLYVAHKEKKLAIVSKYIVCSSCNGTGRIDGKSCPDCELDGWDYAEGIKLNTLGRLLEVRKFRAPDRVEQRAEYESE